MGLGRSLKLGRVKKFIQPMQEDSVILFQHRFVSFLIMMLKIDDFVIELVFDVLTKNMYEYLRKEYQQVSDRERKCGVVMVT